MTKQLRADTLRQYLEYCEEITADSPSVFRGQIRDYAGIVPSLFRGGHRDPGLDDLALRLYLHSYRASVDWEKIRGEFLQKLEDSFGQPIGSMVGGLQWSTAGDWLIFEAMLSGEWPPPWGHDLNYVREDFFRGLESSLASDWDRHGDVLLQHYGVPTRALDVSFDPLVALWFATHAFSRSPGEKASFLPHQSEPSVVYAFPLEQLDVADLRTSIDIPAEFNIPGSYEGEHVPHFGLRGIRQAGGLLFGATEVRPDLRPQVSHVISIQPGIWQQEDPELAPYSFSQLFPPPEEDRFYAALLGERNNPESEYAAVVGAVVEYVRAG